MIMDMDTRLKAITFLVVSCKIAAERMEDRAEFAENMVSSFEAIGVSSQEIALVIDLVLPILLEETDEFHWSPSPNSHG